MLEILFFCYTDTVVTNYTEILYKFEHMLPVFRMATDLSLICGAQRSTQAVG